MPLHVHPMNMQQWNVAYQKQLGNDWLVAATYLGNKTTHQWLGTDLNYAMYVPGASTTGNTNQRRRLFLQNPVEGRYYGEILQTDDNGTGEYNGMLLSLQRRFSDHASWNSNYTLSKCTNDGEVGIDITNTYPEPWNRSSNRGPCSSDRRHLFNSSLILESPGVGGGAVGALTRAWQLSTIVAIRSGGPLTITSGANNALTGIQPQRPVQVGDPELDHPTIDAWFNIAAFAPNPPGVQYGVGRGTLRGPNYWNVDASLSRRLALSGSQHVELRIEAFNVFNHFQPNDPITALNSADFGRIRTAADPRIMQLAVKYVF
jgi:hypothetical protein